MDDEAPIVRLFSRSKHEQTKTVQKKLPKVRVETSNWVKAYMVVSLIALAYLTVEVFVISHVAQSASDNAYQANSDLRSLNGTIDDICNNISGCY